CRRPLHIGARLYKEFIVMLDGNVGPPIPRRNPNLVGKVIDAVDCSSFIFSCDIQPAVHAWKWLRHDANEKRLPFAVKWLHIDFVIADQFIDDFAFSNRVHDDGFGTKALPVARDHRLAAADPLDVRLQIVDGANDTWEVSGVNKQSCGGVSRDDAEITRVIS